MADVAMWQDKQARADFEAKARAILAEVRPALEGQIGVIAIEPESGDYFVGSTLGKANAAAHKKYPDRWVYFARIEKPEAAIALATW